MASGPIGSPMLTYPFLALARLEPLLSSLREQHLQLREQNKRIVTVGVSMKEKLGQIEEGIRIEREQTAVKDAEKIRMFVSSRGDEALGQEEAVDQVAGPSR